MGRKKQSTLSNIIKSLNNSVTNLKERIAVKDDDDTSKIVEYHETIKRLNQAQPSLRALLDEDNFRKIYDFLLDNKPKGQQT